MKQFSALSQTSGNRMLPNWLKALGDSAVVLKKTRAFLGEASARLVQLWERKGEARDAEIDLDQRSWPEEDQSDFGSAGIYFRH